MADELRLTADGLALRTLAADDEEELRRIHEAEGVREWWGAPEEGFPLSDEAETTRLVIEVDDAVAGMVQFYEEPDPHYRHAAIDLFLDPAHWGRGLGAEAMRRVVQHLVEDRGHHRVTTDPAAANERGIRCYEKAGFTRVGMMRRYERDPDGEGWHDGLLMELVVEE